MKTDKIVFRVVLDGVYSGIHAYECSPKLANDLCNDSYPEHYRTFAQAKKKLIEEVKW